MTGTSSGSFPTPDQQAGGSEDPRGQPERHDVRRADDREVPPIERRHLHDASRSAVTTTEASTVPSGRSRYRHTSSAMRCQSVGKTGSTR
jgi:hypothetical protein